MGYLKKDQDIPERVYNSFIYGIKFEMNWEWHRSFRTHKNSLHFKVFAWSQRDTVLVPHSYNKFFRDFIWFEVTAHAQKRRSEIIISILAIQAGAIEVYLYLSLAALIFMKRCCFDQIPLPLDILQELERSVLFDVWFHNCIFFSSISKGDYLQSKRQKCEGQKCCQHYHKTPMLPPDIYPFGGEEVLWSNFQRPPRRMGFYVKPFSQGFLKVATKNTPPPPLESCYIESLKSKRFSESCYRKVTVSFIYVVPPIYANKLRMTLKLDFTLHP